MSNLYDDVRAGVELMHIKVFVFEYLTLAGIQPVLQGVFLIYMSDSDSTRLVLILSDRCPSCREVKHVWSDACAEYGMECKLLDMSMQEGRELAQRHGIIAFPVVLINDEIRAIGAATREQAKALLEGMLIT